MEYKTAIEKRRSFNSFREERLNEETIDGLAEYLSELQLPEPEIDWDFDTLPYIEVMQTSKNGPSIKAPHYLLLRAERKRYSLEKMGYAGALATLYLTEKGIGSRWETVMSINRETEYEGALPYVCAIAFGKSDEEFRKSPSDARRKEWNKIFLGQTERYKKELETAILSPSWQNRQTVRVVTDERGDVHVYRKRNLPGNPIAEYIQCIDSGIMLSTVEHLLISSGYATEHHRYIPEPRFKRLVYEGSIRVVGTSGNG